VCKVRRRRCRDCRTWSKEGWLVYSFETWTLKHAIQCLNGYFFWLKKHIRQVLLPEIVLHQSCTVQTDDNIGLSISAQDVYNGMVCFALSR
jgi:hypothetical protein